MDLRDSNNVIQISRSRCKKSLFHQGPYVLDEEKAFVECKSCGEYLSPISVLKFLAREESVLNMKISQKKEKLNILINKSSCKCQHCGKMTIIDRSLNQ